jgi:uncharacterized protein YecE (DUF72 family)
MMAGSVRIGTSGWSYPSGRGAWSGVFYPPRGARGFRATDELAYYAEHFDTVEVNSSFYRPPTAAAAKRWVTETPRGFEFSVKLYQKFSHAVAIGRGPAPPADRPASGSVLPQTTPADLDAVRAGLDPIASAGKLGALLIQFPPGFHDGPQARQYLADLLATFSDYPVAVELRHRSWSDARDATLALLDGFRAAWVQIDEPKFHLSVQQDMAPNVPALYYLRLHGRNRAQWWNPDAPEDRYDYLYSAGELAPFAEILAAVRPQVEKTLVYFNNHFSAKAVVNAAALKHFMGQSVGGEYRREFLDAYPELRSIVPRTIDDLLDR